MLMIMTVTIYFSTQLTRDFVQATLAVMAIVVIFGVGSITDKIYERNRLALSSVANTKNLSPKLRFCCSRPRIFLPTLVNSGNFANGCRIRKSPAEKRG